LYHANNLLNFTCSSPFYKIVKSSNFIEKILKKLFDMNTSLIIIQTLKIIKEYDFIQMSTSALSNWIFLTWVLTKKMRGNLMESNILISSMNTCIQFSTFFPCFVLKANGANNMQVKAKTSIDVFEVTVVDILTRLKIIILKVLWFP